jgi:hypothetical protein
MRRLGITNLNVKLAGTQERSTQTDLGFSLSFVRDHKGMIVINPGHIAAGFQQMVRVPVPVAGSGRRCLRVNGLSAGIDGISDLRSIRWSDDKESMYTLEEMTQLEDLAQLVSFIATEPGVDGRKLP